jgi:alkaline phosphatase
MAMSQLRLTRRDLLALASAGAGASLLGMPSLACANGKEELLQRVKRAKNIIFMVADGMPVSIPTMTDHYRQLVEGKGSYWMWLVGQPWARTALQDTRSLNSVVTDSSSAASTWGSGRWIWNGQINCYPDGTKLRTLYSILKEQGMRTGLVTTTTITHATPSGFAIVHPKRDAEAEIAQQHLKAEVDVLLGGGDRHFSAAGRSVKRDLYSLFAINGYEVVRNRSDLMKAAGKKVLGIFSGSHLPYTIDRKNSPQLSQTVPTLAEMSAKAIELLKGSKEGFILQIEGGRVDHGNHANDLPASIFDQIEFEEAMKVAVDFALADKETLVIITSDHACGGTALNGAGDEYIDSTRGLRSLEKMTSSWTNVLGVLRASPQPGSIQDLVKTKLAIELSASEAGAVSSALTGKSPFAASSFYGSPNAVFGLILGNHTKVTFTSGNHTNDHVLLTALGPGSENIKGLIQNTSLFDLMLAVRGTSYSNPRMTFEEARRHYYKDQKATAVKTQEDELAHGHALLAT